MSLAENKTTAQSQIVAQLDGQISQLEATAATYRVQYAGAGAQQAYASNLSSQLASLKAQYLVKVGQELTTLTQQILEAESNLKLQETVSKRGQILAEMGWPSLKSRSTRIYSGGRRNCFGSDLS